MAGLPPTFLMPGGPPLPQLPSKRKQFSTSWHEAHEGMLMKNIFRIPDPWNMQEMD